MSDFSGTYFFNEFLRLLHMRNFLTGRIHYPRHYCIAFIRQNRSRAEVTLVKIGRLLHKFSAQMAIFGRIRSKTAKLTPVLGNTLAQLQIVGGWTDTTVVAQAR